MMVEHGWRGSCYITGIQPLSGEPFTLVTEINILQRHAADSGLCRGSYLYSDDRALETTALDDGPPQPWLLSLFAPCGRDPWFFASPFAALLVYKKVALTRI